MSVIMTAVFEFVFFQGMGIFIRMGRPFLFVAEKILGYTTEEIVLAINDLLRHVIDRKNGGLAFWRVLRISKQHRVYAVFGGASLSGKPVVDAFLKLFAVALVGRGESVASGDGTGLMTDMNRAVLSARSGESRSLCFGVGSGITDEKTEPTSDHVVRVRRQAFNTLRELMIPGLGKDAYLVFPGSWGTLAETLDAVMRNYVALRTEVTEKRRPIVLLDMKLADGSFFFQGIDELYFKMQEIGVEKGVDLGLYRFDMEDPRTIEMIFRVVDFFAKHGQFPGAESMPELEKEGACYTLKPEE